MSSCGAAVGSDGTVYFTGDISLYAINPNGTLKWRSAILGDAPSESRPVIGSDGTIYVGCTDDHLYAIKPDGTLKWKFLTGHDVRSSPAIGSDGTIYVGSKDKKLYAVNPDGTLKWSYETGGYIYNGASPAIGSDGTIYVGSKDENLHAINPNGTGKWKYKTGGRIYCTPAIGADGTIYVGSKDKKLYAITDDGTHGTLKWSYETGDGIWRTSPAIDAVGTIYIGSRDKKFYAINPDGTLKWSYETGDIIQWSAPAIGSDGTVYIGSGDGKLYAFGPGQAPCGCVGEHYTFTCGMEVNESCVFNCDMSCPAGHGLVIGSDDIIIDGAGYTIDGVSPATCENADRAGISGTTTNEPRDNVTIKNMEIKNFCCGIHLEGFGALGKFTNVTIDNCTIHDNGVNITARKTHGIKAIKVHDSTIENCKIYNNTGGTGCTPPCENGGSGIFLKIGDDNVITNNEIYDNKKGGFFCKASPKRCEISHNEIWGNHQGGLILRCKCTQNFTIEYNNASCNYGTGIFIGGPCNTIRHNNVSNNMNGAIETLPDTGTNGCGVNFGRDDVGDCGYAPCGSMGSRLNTLINNTICDNEYLDIWERAAVRGTNNGVENKCDEPDGWNDDGVTGCTYPCEEEVWADLSITEKSEEWVVEGSTYNVIYTVKNDGDAEAGASTTSIKIDGTEEATDPVPGLAAGASHTATVGPFTMSGDSDTILVCADKDNAVSESNETNNCVENEFECTSAPQLVTYTISNTTITPPQTTEIDVEFSERVEAWVSIEDSDRNLVNELYHSPGVTDPDPKTWDGTYTDGTQVPDGDYYVNVTGLNTTTGLSVVNDTETITVTSAGEPDIISFAPHSPVSDTEGATRTFNITTNQIVNVNWLINGTEVQTNESVTEASYTNASAVIGTWNVSAVVENANGSDMQTWIWKVTEAGAAPTADSFGVEDASGRSGTYVEVPVSITNVMNGPVQGIRLRVDYNESVLNLMNIGNGVLTSAWTDLRLGEDRHTMVIATAYTGEALPDGSSGSVIRLNFSVIGLPGDTSQMDMSLIELSNPDGEVGTAPAKNGAFTVSKLGSIAGRITYACNETGIAGVNVNLTTESTVNTTVTNETGYYNFTEVIPGSYFVNASKPMFWDNSTEVTVIAGETTTADMMLWLKGDLNGDGYIADAGDVVLMLRASVGDIPGDMRYDLNGNDGIADAGDVVLMLRASVGDIELM